MNESNLGRRLGSCLLKSLTSSLLRAGLWQGFNIAFQNVISEKINNTKHFLKDRSHHLTFNSDGQFLKVLFVFFSSSRHECWPR